MAKILKFKRGNTAKNNAYTGSAGELTVDTTKKTVVVHDGVTPGGSVLATDVTVSTHTSRVDNPHAVTKAQVGLGNVDNTADVNKVVLSASKLTTSRTISTSGDVTGSIGFNGSADVTIPITLANTGVGSGTYRSVTVDTKGRVTAGSNPTTVSEYGLTDVYTKTEVDGKDVTLQANINTEKGRIDAILSASEADKNSFAEIVSLINSVDTTNDTAFAGYVLSNDAAVALKAPIDNPTFTGTVRGITKSMVGLSNVDNTSDANKPISNATQNALNLVSQFSGFKNYIIDGRFDFWYEGTSQTSHGYGSDTMWFNAHVGSTKTHSRQSFSVGETFPDGTPCPTYFSRTVVNSVAGIGNFIVKDTRIEDVTRLAGKTVTLSFYARADSNKNIALEILQNFGSGGSPSAQVHGIATQKMSLTTSWQKITKTITIPSISSKTLGTDGVHTSKTGILFYFDAGSNFNSRTDNLGQQSGTFDIAMVQLEEGSVATPFENTDRGTMEMRVGRYYEQTNIRGTVNNSGRIGNYITFINGRHVYTRFRYIKRKLPDIIEVWNPTTGTLNKTSNESGIDFSCGVTEISVAGVAISNTSGTTQEGMWYQYRADARL